MKLETMPLNFRIWDKEKKVFAQHPTKVDPSGDCYGPFKDGETAEYSDIFTIQDLVRMRHVCRPEIFNKLIISQDTGIKDNYGNKIYTGDIIIFEQTSYNNGHKTYTRDIGYVRYDEGSLYIETNFPDGVHKLDDVYNDNNFFKKIGYVWQDSKLLERGGVE